VQQNVDLVTGISTSLAITHYEGICIVSLLTLRKITKSSDGADDVTEIRNKDLENTN